MFDWPEQNHTSPTTTSVKVSVFAPRTSSRAGSAEAWSASSFSDHVPSALVTVSLLCPAKATVTRSPGAAHPQTGTTACCCKTMPFPKIFGIRTAA